jgi:ATP-dependent Clp endopeptidase proteolytic subunit ClpP
MGQNWYSIQAAKREGEPAEVAIYDEIGLWGVTAKDFITAIRDLGDINLTIHSPGGDVMDGLAIYNALRKHEGTVVTKVDTLAASMASVIALAGNYREISDNGFVMVHNPWSIALGDSKDFKKRGEDLQKIEDRLVAIYVDRTGKTDEEVRSMMDEETWMTGDEAFDNGFADKVVTATKAAASLRDFRSEIPRHFSHWPSASVRRPEQPKSAERNNPMPENNDKLLELQAKAKDAEAAVQAKDKELEGLKNQLKAAHEQVDKATENARTEASAIVALGKAHDKLDLAVTAIADGSTVDEFKTKILDAYLQGNDSDSPPADAQGKVDPNAEPESREDFLATYNSLSGREASRYWSKYNKNFLK